MVSGLSSPLLERMHDCTSDPIQAFLGKNANKNFCGTFKNTGETHQRFALANIKIWLPDKDSNLDKKSQNLLCYHYTIGQ